MTGFIASQPDLPVTPAGVVVAIPPGPTTAEQIANEPFFPLIETGHMRQAMRLDGTTTPTRLRDALIDAMSRANNELAAYTAEQQALGFPRLEDVPSPTIDGKSKRLIAYLRAVQHGAMAILEDTKRAQATLPAGIGKDQRVLESVGLRQSDHWQAMSNALRDLQGRMRENVDLV